MEIAARHHDRRPPWCCDLAAVGVAADRQAEFAIADYAQRFRGMHQNDASSRRVVHRELRSRVAARDVRDAADRDVVEWLRETDRLVVEDADACVAESAQDSRTI